MWPLKKKNLTHSFNIGNYRLNAPVSDYSGLKEFSDTEYTHIPREFKGGKNFNAPPVVFLDHEWNLQLGTVDNVIYKVAPYILADTKDEANTIAMQTLQYCTQELGKPSSQKTGLFIWDTLDGNVVFQTGETADGWSINIFITSSIARNYTN